MNINTKANERKRYQQKVHGDSCWPLWITIIAGGGTLMLIGTVAVGLSIQIDAQMLVKLGSVVVFVGCVGIAITAYKESSPFNRGKNF